ncbi:tetratricopeptide repeat protein [Dongia sp.]|uniref:tetratricopeptide repeat protein n=1 Tax=Dongia sp. TaxID=1977262 RepID=UPI0035B151F0
MLARQYLVTTITAITLTLALTGCETVGLDGDEASEAQATGSTQLDPQILEAARRAEAQHNYIEAAQHYQSLLARDGGNLDLAMGLVRNLRYGGSNQQAIEVLNNLIAREGRTVALLSELGKAYVSADQMNLAIPVLEEARGIDSSLWDIHAALGVAYDYEGRFDEARQSYAAAMLLSPRNPDILNNLALSQAQSGDLDGAIATMNQAADQPSASSQVRQNLALLLALKGDPDAADRWARKDLPREIADENAKYYRYLAGLE